MKGSAIRDGVSLRDLVLMGGESPFEPVEAATERSPPEGCNEFVVRPKTVPEDLPSTR